MTEALAGTPSRRKVFQKELMSAEDVIALNRMINKDFRK
jgi:hypothetical protein